MFPVSRSDCQNSAATEDSPPPAWAGKWRVAMRTFSFPASTMSVVFGTALAATVGQAPFQWVLFLASFFGMALLHAGANLLNDVYDFRKGLDRHVNPVSGAVVRGWITPGQALTAGWLLLGLGSALGLYLVGKVGLPILWIGLAGVAIGVLYTWGPFPLKFNALGDLAVFTNFGVLGTLGAWTVQTGRPAWFPAFWAVPMSLLVVGILHANNWRDIRSDTGGGIRTMASLLGDRFSEAYYAFMILGPFALILLLMLLSRVADLGPKMPYAFLITFLASPLALGLLKKARQRHAPRHPLDFAALDGATAKLNLVFSVLCTLALGLDALIRHLAA